MEHIHIIELLKARQLYAEAGDLSWSEGRKKLELLKQADKACKKAIAELPTSLDALMLSGHVLTEMAAWQFEHPHAQKRYFQRGLDRFRKAAEAHPDQEKPFVAWKAVLGAASQYAELKPRDLREMALDCAKWCERFATTGHRFLYVAELWQTAALKVEHVIADEGELTAARFREVIEIRLRIAEVFDEMPDVLEDESAAIVRLAQWLDDGMPERGNEALEFALGLGERIEELDPQRSAAARTIEAEALIARALSVHAEADEAFGLWTRAKEKMRAAREELAGERDDEGRAGDREAQLFKDFTSESLQLAISPAYDGHPSARAIVERTIEVLRETPEVLPPEQSDRHLLKIVQDLSDVAVAFRETDLSMARQVYEDALSLLELVDSAALPQSGRMRLRAEIFEELRLAYYRVEPETALEYAREAADHYTASDELGSIDTPELLWDWSRAAAHAAQGAREAGEADRANDYYRTVATALARLDEWETLDPRDLLLWTMSHFLAIDTSSASEETSAGEYRLQSGIDLVCRTLRKADESSWMPKLVLIGLTLARKLSAEEEADAIAQIAEAVDANADVVDSPHFIQGLFAARLGEVDRAVDLLQEALESGEVEYEELAEIDFSEGLTETERWQQFTEAYGSASDDETAAAQDQPDELKLPLDFEDGDLEAVD